MWPGWSLHVSELQFPCLQIESDNTLASLVPRSSWERTDELEHGGTGQGVEETVPVSFLLKVVMG